jgi:hypothetical protein
MFSAVVGAHGGEVAVVDFSYSPPANATIIAEAAMGATLFSLPLPPLNGEGISNSGGEGISNSGGEGISNSGGDIKVSGDREGTEESHNEIHNYVIN